MNAHQDRQTLRILVVEDNPDIAENIGDYFEAQGHIVDFAMDGIGGMHLALTQAFDVIILDIMLPGMDGLTFCRKLREQGGMITWSSRLRFGSLKRGYALWSKEWTARRNRFCAFATWSWTPAA